VFRAALARHERSPRGLRLTLVGIGLFMLGLTVGVALAAVVRGTPTSSGPRRSATRSSDRPHSPWR
jgi:hypothetical protein